MRAPVCTAAFVLLAACSGGGDSSSSPSSASALLLLFAGDPSGSAAFADGAGAAARFGAAGGIAADRAGNLYVSDVHEGTNRFALRKITPAGVVTTLVDDIQPGLGETEAGGVAVDASGNIFFADNLCFVAARVATCQARIRRMTAAGEITTVAITGSSDNTGTDLGRVWALAIDASGNILVADNFRVAVRRITPAGDMTTLLVGGFPSGIAIDGQGNIFVGNAFTIVRITPAGTASTFAGLALTAGGADGSAGDARFSNAKGLAIDASGNLYVADNGNNTIRKITPDGFVTTIAGQAGQAGFQGGPLPGLLRAPVAVALVDNAPAGGNDLYIAMPTTVAVVRPSP